MRILQESENPRRRCTKIIRPTDARWLPVGPLRDVPLLIKIHRFRRRTVECYPEDCPCCANLVTSDERLFLPVLFGSPVKRGVLELPASHRAYLNQLATEYHTLRALTLECRRKNGLSNGPIEWRVFPRSTEPLYARDDKDWLGELSETWSENTVFAHSQLEPEKTVRDVRSGCDISSGSDR